jgi:hypothetical protein
MKIFDPTDAVFFGFRIIRRDPILVLALGGLSALLSLLGAQLVAMAIEDAGGEGGGPFLAAAGVVFLLAGLLAWLVTQGALLRSLVHDQRDGWVLGMRFGGDELRIFAATLVVFLLLLLLGCGVLLIVAVIAGVFAAIHPAVGAAAALAASVAGLLAMMVVAARLSVAAPASVGEKRLVVFRSWRLLRGRGWGVAGAYVVLFFLTLVAGLILFVPMAFLAPEAMALLHGMTAPDALENPAAAFQSPGYIAVTIANAILGVVLASAWSGVGAYAYRMLGAGAGYGNARPPEEAAAT